jgi:hypothetical protein
MAEQDRQVAQSLPAQPTRRLRSGILQRTCACGNHAGGGACAACREKHEHSLQRAAVANGPDSAPPIVHDVLRSPGQPLDATARAFMEPRFGHDFSGVRVHTDAHAAESAQSVNALAYTVGSHIAFGAGQYAPGTTAGRRLLAHELTHTIQQGGFQQAASALVLNQPGDGAEREAELAEQQVAQGQSFTAVLGRGLHIARRVPIPDDLPPEERRLAQEVLDEQQRRRMWIPPDAFRTVKVWVNAFIPRTASGAQTVPDGPHAGATMIDGPIPYVSDCFLTDNRSFDANIHASSRLHSEIEYDVSARGAGPRTVSEWHHCDPSIEVDCEDGEEECNRSADSSQMSFWSERILSSQEFSVDLRASASNGCYSGSPDVDIAGTITINVGNRTVLFDGLIEPYPAFEMYVTTDGGAGLPVFREAPLPGTTPWNLPGSANRGVRASKTF